MAPTILYSVTVLGAIGFYLLVKRGRVSQRVIGTLIALGVFGWLMVNVAKAIGASDAPSTFFVIFSGLAVICAAKMVTHARPVYSALYFVLVVLSSAGLFLLLGAEFMAFSLVIVYAGAIVITYMFVLMLAQQSADPNSPAGQADYDVSPREPAAAVTVGFIMMALIAGLLFDGAATTLDRPNLSEARRAAWSSLERMPRQLEQTVQALEPNFEWIDESRRITVAVDGAGSVVGQHAETQEPLTVQLPMVTDAELGTESVMPDNIQQVGLALVADFPASLELAGVILLMAMFGAVVLARRQIELGEDELRVSVGMQRLSHDADAAEAESGGGE